MTHPRASGRQPNTRAELVRMHRAAPLFESVQFHAFFTTNDLDTVAADKTHRQDAIIEQVNTDLKDSLLARLLFRSIRRQCGVDVLVTIAFNRSRVPSDPRHHRAR